MQLPKKTYIIPPSLLILLRFGAWMLEQGSSGSEYWQKLPFAWASAVVVAFWVGLFVQDFYNKRSWIWENIKSLRQLFVIEWVNLIHKYDDDKEWFELNTKIKFSANAKKVRVVVQCDYMIGSSHARQQFIIETREFENIDRNQEEIFTIAVFPVRTKQGGAPGYYCWGNKYRPSGDTEGMKSLSGGTESIVQFEATAGWKRQEETVFLATLSGTDGSPKLWATYSNSPTLDVVLKN